MQPQDFYFSNQAKDECILRVIHRHWFDIFIQYLPVIGVLIAITGLLFALPYVFDTFASVASVPFFFFLLTFFLIVLWIYSFLIWTDYYLDIWIITTKRVTNVEQKGLFVRHVSELRFSQIQDVAIEITGFIPTFLNYGDVHIQTAGEEARFTFHNVPDPYRLKTMIVDVQKKYSAQPTTVAAVEQTATTGRGK